MALVSLLLLALAHAKDLSAHNECWKDTYGRGVGKVIRVCKPHQHKSGLLCYPHCKAGYVGVGPVCWHKCPNGFRDDGAFCAKKDWWKSKCPTGWADIGVSCTKPSYGRGVGVPLGCTTSEELNGALCYPHCRAGYKGNGPVCWHVCPAGWHECGGAMCTRTKEACTAKILKIVGSAISAVGAAATVVGAGVAVGETVKFAGHLTLPKCSKHAKPGSGYKVFKPECFTLKPEPNLAIPCANGPAFSGLTKEQAKMHCAANKNCEGFTFTNGQGKYLIKGTKCELVDGAETFYGVNEKENCGGAVIDVVDRLIARLEDW